MHADRGAFLRALIAYFRHVERWPDLGRAAIGGYAAAMFFWEMTQRSLLPAFVLENSLPLAARMRLALLLLAGVAAALLLWAAAGWALARLRRRSADQALQRAARLLFLAAPLPLLPLLAIQTAAPFFTVGVIVAAAALAWAAGRGVLTSPRPAAIPEGAQQTLASVHLAPATARLGLILTLLLALGYALFMSVLTAARHNSFMTHAFDLGIHDQAIFNVLHSGYMRTTLYGPYAIDYIGDHFSPILYALAPLYAAGGDARLLLALQSIVLAAGAIPVYLLAIRKTRSVLLGVALAAGYLLYPALHGVNLRDFHQIALVCAPLLAALYFLESGRTRAFLIALGLALLVKEEVSLTVAALGAYVFLAKRRRGLGAGLALTGLAYFAVVTGWVMPALGGKPQIDTRFGGIIAPGAQGAIGVAWTLLTNPVYTAVTILGNPQKLGFLFQIFAPVLFLPLLASPQAWIPALPALAVQLLTSAHTQYDITYHYSAHLIPFVFFLTTLGVQRALGRVQFAAAGRWLALALGVASLALSYQYGRLIPRQGVEIPRPDAHAAVIRRFMAQLPADASVSTMSDIVPHLTTRRTIYLFPDVADAEYLLLDTAPQANFWPHEGLKARERAIADMLPHIQGGQFGLVGHEDGVLLLRRGLTPPRTEEALRALFAARYEAEMLGSDFAAAVAADAQASNGRARIATPTALRPDGKTALAFGPYTDLPPGRYRVEYVLKSDRAGQDARVATVDVFTHHDGGLPRATRDIMGADFAAADTYQRFALEFETDRPLADLEFRVLYAGVGALGLDAIIVTPLELWLK